MVVLCSLKHTCSNSIERKCCAICESKSNCEDICIKVGVFKINKYDALRLCKGATIESNN